VKHPTDKYNDKPIWERLPDPIVPTKEETNK